MSDLLRSYENQANTIIKALESRQMNGYFVENKEEAKEKVLQLLSDNSVISWGGSITLDQIGIKEALYNGPYKLLDRATAKSSDESKAIYRQALSADYYLTSTNAITLDGKLVNIDGNGNRVAAMVAFAISLLHLILSV
jgi:mRNA-degrading endonuclease HigB of HigAB toxin-antitoxin module